jgi:hypothetical protein
MSEYDACLFVSDIVIYIVNVDDTLFFSPRQEYIDEMIVKLEEAGLQLEAEDNVDGFLGVLIECWNDGTILMTQPGLTHRILKALKIDKLPPKRTPAKHGALGKDEDGEEAHGEYSFPSVIGIPGTCRAIAAATPRSLLANVPGLSIAPSAPTRKHWNVLGNT